MQKRRRILMCLNLILISVSLYVQQTHAKFETGTLKSTAAPAGLRNTAPAKEKTVGPKKTKKPGASFDISSASVSNLVDPQMRDTIEAINHLLAKNPQGKNRDTLLFNQSTAIIQQVRYNIAKSPGFGVSPTDKKDLQLVIKRTDELQTSKTADQQLRAKSAYLGGVAAVYLDSNELAKTFFKQSLDYKVPYDKAGTAGMFLAEQYFDDARYKDAIGLYRQYFSLFTNQEKEIALYKLGWSYLNTNQPLEAEKFFKKLILMNSKSGFGKDSVRDLAYLYSNLFQNRDALAAADELFKDTAEKIDFLESIRRNLENQKLVAEHSKIVQKLLILESSNSKRQIELRIAHFRTNRKEVASSVPLQAFLELKNYIIRSKISPISEDFNSYAILIESELVTLIRNFIEAYTGRVRPAEAFTKDQLAQALYDALTFYLEYFQNSKTRNDILQIHLDLCVDQKKWTCVEKLTHAILRENKAPADKLNQALLNMILALDELNKTDQKSTYRARYLSILERFHRDRVGAPEWLDVSGRYAAVLLEEKKPIEALQVLDIMFMKQPSAERFYRLQWVRFQNQMYSEVMSDSRGATLEAKDKRILELKRESALKLAEGGQKTGDKKAYEENIKKFINITDDPAKAKIARIDYLNVMINQKRYDELTDSLKLLPTPTRISPDYNTYLLTAWSYNLKAGKYQTAYDLLTGPDQPAAISQDIIYRQMFTGMILGRIPVLQDLKKLKQEQREHLYSFLVVTQPRVLLGLFEQIRPSTPLEKSLLILAWKISNNSWLVQKSAKSMQVLGKDFNFFSSDPSYRHAIEDRILKVVFPDPKSKGQGYDRKLQASVMETQKLRQSVLPALAGQQLDVQVRILKLAMDLEQKTAQAILNSPKPAEITDPAQMEKYNNEIKKIASSFEIQSAEFEKTLKTVQDEMNKQIQEVKNLIVPQPAIDRWNWPSGLSSDDKLRIRTLASSGNAMGALVYVDFLRQTNKFSDEDFFNLRLAALFTTPTNDALRIQLHQELKNNHLDALLAIWRSMVL